VAVNQPGLGVEISLDNAAFNAEFLEAGSRSPTLPRSSRAAGPTFSAGLVTEQRLRRLFYAHIHRPDTAIRLNANLRGFGVAFFKGAIRRKISRVTRIHLRMAYQRSAKENYKSHAPHISLTADGHATAN
jgi:hypothetical protein